MRYLVWLLAVALFVLHQDWWWWHEARPLVFGFLPIGLAYHALYSLMAGALWALAVIFAWPRHIEEYAVEQNPEAAREKEPPVL